MAETLVAIPLYEPVMMGFPTYIWIIIALVVGIIFMLLAFKTEVYDPLSSVWGVRGSTRSGKLLGIVNSLNGKIVMEEVENIANIFESMGLPLKWILTAPSQGQLGKANTLYLSDDWNVIHNLDIDYAIVAAAETWNAKEAGKPEPEQDLIYDWKSFETHLMDGSLDGMFPNDIKLPPFRVVNLHEVRRYLPKWMPAHHSGYINAKIAERLEGEEKQGMGVLKYFLAGCFLLLITFIVMYGITSVWK